ncbi:hypothetical protein [Dyadobacter sp. 3J3]|uniref:hypothetical protein n=1 Tax=Dyadobacter sp. 3J3 TaxID=2606600 RepID=UPI001358E728|nr:hypothetical protein [Dyadobacter sp. 3J3]
MHENIYALPTPSEMDPEADIHFVAGKNDMPTEIESLNAFSETIREYIGHPHFFDFFSGEKPIDDIFWYLIFNYQKVVQYYLHAQITQNEDSRFIITHFDYFYGHFAKTVKYEGSKKFEKTIDLITAVFNYFDKNEPIEILDSFESQDKMVEYYLALKNLYYGDPTLYLEVVGKYL